jgi:hypothetical protein
MDIWSRDDGIVDQNAPASRALQPCRQAQKRGLATPRWPQQANNFARFDVQANAANGMNGTKPALNIVECKPRGNGRGGGAARTPPASRWLLAAFGCLTE